MNRQAAQVDPPSVTQRIGRIVTRRRRRMCEGARFCGFLKGKRQAGARRITQRLSCWCRSKALLVLFPALDTRWYFGNFRARSGVEGGEAGFDKLARMDL